MDCTCAAHAWKVTSGALAYRSNRKLEDVLDWVLCAYRVAFPFLVRIKRRKTRFIALLYTFVRVQPVHYCSCPMWQSRSVTKNVCGGVVSALSFTVALHAQACLVHSMVKIRRAVEEKLQRVL